MCVAVASGDGDDSYALRFELRNRGEVPIELPSYEPFIAFSVLATADGRPLTVHQPALDIPVNPVLIRLPPGDTLTVRTPIRLRIAEGAERGTDGFIWTIAHRREDVSIRIRLDLPPPFALTCPLSFE